MSRSLAIALILTGAAVLGSLVYLQYWWMRGEQGEVLGYAYEINKETIEKKEQNMAEAIYRFNDLMQKDSKARFLPIATSVERISKNKDRFLRVIRKQSSSEKTLAEDIQRLRNNHFELLFEETKLLFNKYGDQFDLRPEDIEERLRALRALVDKKQSLVAPSLPEQLNRYALSLVKLDYLNTVDYALAYLMQIAGGKTLGCDVYFPIIMADVVNPKPGEIVNAKVSIGSYSTSLDPDQVVLMANQDTLTFNPDGTADYSFSSKKRGDYTIDLNFQIINPYTGAKQTGAGSYTYNIK